MGSVMRPKHREDRIQPRGILIGIEAGQRRHASGIAVVTAEERWNDDGPAEIHFLVRALEQLETGTTFVQIADRFAEIVRKLYEQGHDSWPTVYVDATGAGKPLVELLVARSQLSVRPVYFNHGDRRHDDGQQISLGKVHLVARLQVLLQTGQLHLPRTKAVEKLAQELLDYEIQIAPDANERSGAFRVGRHDELVTAVGLAVQVDPPRPATFKVGFY